MWDLAGGGDGTGGPVGEVSGMRAIADSFRPQRDTWACAHRGGKLHTDGDGNTKPEATVGEG